MMTIARKPQGAVAEQQVEALINKGGGVPAAAAQAGKTAGHQVLLRMPADLLHRVNRAMTARPLPTTRHAWLLEAVLEQLQREE